LDEAELHAALDFACFVWLVEGLLIAPKSQLNKTVAAKRLRRRKHEVAIFRVAAGLCACRIGGLVD
jgi:hypothetical protein